VPIVPNASVVSLTQRGTCEGQEVLNRTYWQVTGGGAWSNISMQELAVGYTNWWGTVVQPLVHVGYVMTELVLSQQVQEGLQLIHTAGLPLSGSLVGDALPLNVAACVTFATGRAGRSGRGRYYLGALAENASSGSRFTVPFVAAVNSAFASLRVLPIGSVGSSYSLVVYSTEFNKIPRAAGLASLVSSCYLRDSIIDSQRRRLPGRGR